MLSADAAVVENINAVGDLVQSQDELPQLFSSPFWQNAIK